jgi:hypothetical protein
MRAVAVEGGFKVDAVAWGDIAAGRDAIAPQARLKIAAGSRVRGPCDPVGGSGFLETVKEVVTACAGSLSTSLR